MPVNTISTNRIVYRNGRATNAAEPVQSTRGGPGACGGRGGQGGSNGQGERGGANSAPRNHPPAITFDKRRGEQLDPLMQAASSKPMSPSRSDCEGWHTRSQIRTRIARSRPREHRQPQRRASSTTPSSPTPQHLEQGPDPQWLKMGVKYHDLKRVNGTPGARARAEDVQAHLRQSWCGRGSGCAQRHAHACRHRLLWIPDL